MIKERSKVGILFVGFYFLLIILTLIMANICSGMYCGMIIVLPIMPWAMLTVINIPDFIAYVLFAIINTLIVYLIGYGIQKTYIKYSLG